MDRGIDENPTRGHASSRDEEAIRRHVSLLPVFVFYLYYMVSLKGCFSINESNVFYTDGAQQQQNDEMRQG